MAQETLYQADAPSPDLLQQWIQRQADLLLAERKEEQQETRLLLSKCPPKQLERNGVALLGLGIQSVSVGLGGKVLVELERPAAYHTSPSFPPHSIRPGDIVQLDDHEDDRSNGKGKTKPVVDATSGVVYRVSDSKIVVATSNKNKDGDMAELPNRIRVVKVANEATFDRMEHFLVRLSKVLGVSVKTSRRSANNASSSESEGEHQVAGTSSASSPLVAGLMAQSAPTWSDSLEELPMPLLNPSLNASQLAAIHFALRASQFALIHGPPGTGKTATVAELVLQLAIGQGKRVLVCGASNLAADNLLERIIANGGDELTKRGVGVTRLGREYGLQFFSISSTTHIRTTPPTDPARVLKSLITKTLDYQAQNSDEGALLRDVRKELEESFASLRPREAAGNKSTSFRGQASTKGKLKGHERKERREEIKLLRKEYRKRERGLIKTVIKRASIVVATCHGAGGRQLDGMDFDVVIIDEACQATEAACWIPIMRAKPDGTVVLAGDHLQLPPTVKGYRHSQQKKGSGRGKRAPTVDQCESAALPSADSGSDNDDQHATFAAFSRLSTRPHKTQLRPARSLETTMFSRLLGLYGPGCKALLDTQYRMNEEIMRFPNAALYEGKIKAAASCATIRLLDLAGYADKQPQSETPDEEPLSAPLVFYDTVGSEMFESMAAEGTASFQSESKSNANEIDIVSRHVRLLLDNGLDPMRISILSPYNLQVSLLSDHMRSLGGGCEKVTIGSIDSMQGMENDVIVVSLVRSNEERSVGFLAEKKRLNVAMTRAKRQLCIVGDSGTIAESKDDYLEAWMAFLEDHAVVEPVVGL